MRGDAPGRPRGGRSPGRRRRRTPSRSASARPAPIGQRHVGPAARARARGPRRCGPPPRSAPAPPSRAAWIATWPTDAARGRARRPSRPAPGRPGRAPASSPRGPRCRAPPPSRRPSPSGTGTTASSGTAHQLGEAAIIGRHHTRVPAGVDGGGDDLAHGLGPRDERRLGERHVEAAGGDGQVHGIERDGAHAHQRAAGRRLGLGGVGELGRRSPGGQAERSHRAARYRACPSDGRPTIVGRGGQRTLPCGDGSHSAP